MDVIEVSGVVEVEGRVLAQALGVGLERLEPQLPAMRGITPRGEIAVALAQSEVPVRLTFKAAEVAAGVSAQAMRGHLHKQSTWFARHFNKSVADRAKDLRKVNGAAAAGAVVVVERLVASSSRSIRWGSALTEPTRPR
jgi:hypothetical protein